MNRRWFFIKASKQLQDYWNLLFPFELEEDEYVRVVGKGVFVQVWFIKTLEELADIIIRYNRVCNLWISLSTNKGNRQAQAENMYRRSVVMLDFDKKDMPGLNDFKDAIRLIKAKYGSLFYHCVVDTGHGYHFYFAIEPTTDIQAVTQLNKTLAQNLGTDTKACIITQVARCPGSKNLKDKDNIKPVSTICNEVNSQHFRRTKLTRLQMLIGEYEPPDIITPMQYEYAYNYLCCERIIHDDAVKGERNLCLGRITKYYQDVMGLTEERALKNVLEWNSRCSPPKNTKEVTADFERYWNVKYNLLGCKCNDNAAIQSIIDKFCDPFFCKTRINGADETIDSIQIEILRLDNNLWSVKNMERLKGFHYLILSLLNFYEDGLNTKRIKEILTNRKSKRIAISEPILYSVLEDLVRLNFVSCTKGKPNFYQALPIANYAKGYTRIAYTTGLLLINEIITQTEYLIYLYLAMSIQKGTSMTYENIERDLDIDSKNINKYIKNLVSIGILKVDKKFIESRGIYYNRYTLIA